MTRTARVVLALVYALVLTVGIALGIRVMVEGYSPVPFADFWSQFSFIRRALAGDMSLADLWAQHNEHRIVLARLQFVVDYEYFAGTNVFLFTSIAASCLTLAATFAAAVWLDTRDRLLVLGSLAVASASALSPAGIENLTWAFQVQFVQVFLFAALAVLAVAVAGRYAEPSRQVAPAAGSAVAAVAATYSMANGILVWPVVLVLALVRVDHRVALGLVAVGAATVASYLWHFEFTTRGSVSDPVGIVHFLCLYLGSGVARAGATAATLVGAVGLVLFALLCVLAWGRRALAAVAVPFGAGVACFVLLSGAQTAVGRLHLGTEQALSSRYSIASATFWLGLLVGFLLPLRDRIPAQGAAPAYLAVAGLAVLAVGYGALPAESPRTTVFGKDAAVLAYLVGVADGPGTTTGLADNRGVPVVFSWMQRERLGPWAPGGVAEGMEVPGELAPTRASCRGAIEAAEPVGGGIRLRGWIESPRKPSSRAIAVLDGSGDRLGLGRTRGSGSTEFLAYARDATASEVQLVLLDRDRRAPVCSLTSKD